MTSKFEQLIEYVINDEEAKAKELFHDIVVEKSREIYENLMQEEDQEDLEESDELDEGLEDGHQQLGGDAAEQFMDEVETEEEGMFNEEDETAEFDDEAEEDGDDLTKDIEDGDFGDEAGEVMYSTHSIASCTLPLPTLRET